MTVQEFYDFCVKRGLTDAELAISLKSVGRDSEHVPVTKWNIDCSISKPPDGKRRKIIILGG